MAYTEIPIERIFYDPDVPTETMTPTEWADKFGINIKKEKIKGSKFDSPQYDEYIIRSYVEQHKSLEDIGRTYGLSYQHIKYRLDINNIELRKQGKFRRKDRNDKRGNNKKRI